MTDKLPNASRAYVEEKRITTYLLDLAHNDGKSKAKFFRNRGFAPDQWQVMEQALISQGQDNGVTRVIHNEWGTRYQVDCHCPTPDATNPCIRTVWQIALGESCPRLLTAHPLPN